MFAFARNSCWPISEGEKSNQRILLQRGKETWRKERRETDRERSKGRGEIGGSDSESMMRREKKVKEREKKWESLSWERVGAKNFLFPVTTEVMEKDKFIGDVMHEREIIFQYFFFFWETTYRK